MVDISLLEELGITPANIAAVIVPSKDNAAPQENREKFERQRLRIRDRIRRGIDENLRTWRLYHALDLAMEVPLRQITPTLLQSKMDSDPDKDPDLNVLLGELNMTHLLVDGPLDPKTNKPKKVLNLPTFFNIFVPLVKAYVTIRLARIMNQRNLVPFFKYEPLYSTIEDTIRAEVITSRVEAMNRQYGFYEVLKKAGFNMLHYGRVLQFVSEEWHREYQYTKNKEKSPTAAEQDIPPQAKMDDDLKADAMAPPSAVNPAVADGTEPATLKFPKNDFRKIVEKEGLRFHCPHPTRMFWDKAHAATTLNTGTGCRYSGYWKIMPYGEILDNPGFFNRDRINIGQTSYLRASAGFFQNVYPCVMNFPPYASEDTNDRESTQERALYYGGDMRDKSVLVTEYFEQIIPSEWGFGNYDCPVWFRFVCASDDTIIYAAPLPYEPTGYAGYDCDEARDVNSSLTLEVVPFQDQIGQLLSQQVLSVKQNLSNLTLVDEDILTAEDMAKFRGGGLYTSINIQQFSSAKLKKKFNFAGQQTTTARDAMFTLPFRPVNTQELIAAIRMLLEILERVLVMSSQEIAQAASHEQTKEEVKNISSSTSTRLEYTSTPIDNLMDVMKRQIYEGLMNYGDANFYAEITIKEIAGVKITDELLKKMGFTVDDDVYADKHGTKKRRVKVPITAIREMQFASNRDGSDRFNDGQLAGAITQFLSALMSNPVMMAALGPDQGINLMNQAMMLAGFPQYIRLENTGKKPEMDPKQVAAEQKAQQEQLMQAIAKMTDQKLAQLAGMINQEIGKLAQQTQQEIAGVAKGVQGALAKHEEAIGHLAQADQATAQHVQQVEQAVQQIAPVVEATAKATATLVDHAHANETLQQQPQNPNALITSPAGAPGG